MMNSDEFNEDHREAVADGRYLIRRAFRIIDQDARKEGVDPLAFQALVQLAGVETRTLTVTELSIRLDVPRGLASRLVSQLEVLGFVERVRSGVDKRIRLVHVTDTGLDLIRLVYARVRTDLAALQNELPDERRVAALRVWARNFGLIDHPAAAGLLEEPTTPR